MKIECTQENLFKGLNKVVHIAGKNANLPILNNILLKADESGFCLISTNLEIGIKTKVRGKVESMGALTVPSRLMGDYTALLPSGNVTLLKEDEATLKIFTSSQETVIRGQGEDEYPIVPDVNCDDFLAMECQDFREALSQVAFSASYDEIRPELSGVLFTIKEKELFLAATDSYRLSEKKVALAQKRDQNELIKIVPLRMIQELLRSLSEETEKLALGFCDNQIVVKFGETVIISRLVEGNYPEYKEIIPLSFKTKALFERAEMIKIIKTASLFAKTGINDVLLQLETKSGRISVSTTNSQVGENKGYFQSEISGNDNYVVFNHKYLLDGLQNISTKRVSMEMNSPDAPVVFRPEGKDDYLYLVMPIRK